MICCCCCCWLDVCSTLVNKTAQLTVSQSVLMEKQTVALMADFVCIFNLHALLAVGLSPIMCTVLLQWHSHDMMMMVMRLDGQSDRQTDHPLSAEIKIKATHLVWTLRINGAVKLCPCCCCAISITDKQTTDNYCWVITQRNGEMV